MEPLQGETKNSANENEAKILVRKPVAENKQLITTSELKFGDLSVPVSKVLSTDSPRSVNRYKAVLKMRGIDMGEVFSKTRHKPTMKPSEEFDDQPTARRIIRTQRKTRPKAKLNFHLPDIRVNNGSVSHRTDNDRDSKILSSNERLQNGTNKSDTEDAKEVKSLAVSELVEEYQHTPGLRSKVGKQPTKCNLGCVVSSGRMRQLLDAKSPLRMENFYNYYP